MALACSVILMIALVDSFWTARSFSHVNSDHSVLHAIVLSRGRIGLNRADGRHFSDDGSRGWSYESESAFRWPYDQVLKLATHGFGFAGFMYVSEPSTGFWVIVLPLWMPVALLGLPAIVYLIARRRRHQAGPYDCPVCGYDLRASSGRCPECGNPKVD